MALLINFKTSSLVSAAATQPGKSGTYAPKLVSPLSTTTAYLNSLILLLLQTCLLQNTIQGSRRHVNIRLARYGHRATSVGILKLAVTSFGPCQTPSSFFEKLDDLPDFHLSLSSVLQRQSHQS